MKIIPRQKIDIPVWTVFAVGAIASLGWMVASFFFAELHTTDIAAGIVAGISKAVFQALFLGFTVTVALNALLRLIEDKSPEGLLKATEIAHIYAARQEASEELEKLVKSRTVNKVDIAGISLRDFLLSDGQSGVWDAITTRLRQENENEVDDHNRLRVRLLFLDPKSSEGRFRYDIEREWSGDSSLSRDVPKSIEVVRTQQQSIFEAERPTYLQMRLYEHCPFSFVFVTDRTAFVQQYAYRKPNNEHAVSRGSMPLIKYEYDSARFEEIVGSIDKIWTHGAPVENEDQEHVRVGTAAAIEKAGVTNIYTKNTRPELGRAQFNALRRCEEGDEVEMLAITAAFFCDRRKDDLVHIILPCEKQGRGITVRLAVVNPTSQQAILRAVGDQTPPREMRHALTTWNWQQHKQSALYEDVHRTRKQVERWKEDGCKIDLRLYSAAISCSLLLTPRTVFVEHYLYGRSKKLTENRSLGGEYPVFEFRNDRPESDAKIEVEILSSTFDVIWNCYSIDSKEYFAKVDEEREFAINLKQLLNELNYSQDELSKETLRQNETSGSVPMDDMAEGDNDRNTSSENSNRDVKGQ